MSIFPAIEAGDLSEVRRLVSGNPSLLKEMSSSGGLPIHQAAWFGKEAIVEELLRLGADVNALDVDQRSALHCAALNNHVGASRVLVAQGASLDPVERFGFTPLVYAIRERTSEGEEIARLLLESGAEYDVMAAVARGDLERIRQLFSREPVRSS